MQTASAARTPRVLVLGLCTVALVWALLLPGPGVGAWGNEDFDEGLEDLYEPEDDEKEDVYGGEDIVFENEDSEECLDNCQRRRGA